MNIVRSLLDDIKTNFNGIDTFKEWKRGDYQKKLRNGVHQEKKMK